MPSLFTTNMSGPGKRGRLLDLAPLPQLSDVLNVRCIAMADESSMLGLARCLTQICLPDGSQTPFCRLPWCSHGSRTKHRTISIFMSKSFPPEQIQTCLDRFPDSCRSTSQEMSEAFPNRRMHGILFEQDLPEQTAILFFNSSLPAHHAATPDSPGD